MAEKNGFKKIGKFFREVRAEFKKIVWPTFKQLRNNTVVVIVSVIIVGIFIGLLDLLFGWGLKELVNIGGATTSPTVGFLGL